MEDLTGKQLGPYRVIEPLGEGGMATVYKAYQPGVDRYVALKVLPRHFASDPQFVGRFEQEAKVIANLQHPHILPVHDFGQADGYTYIVMPFVESGTLADLLQAQPLPFRQIRQIISQVGDALDYAHSRGLVHRDVKPSNVLIDTRGNCLLADFGIAKIIEGTSKFTATGGVIGTPAYMSPEQGMSEKVDRRSDIYSLGVILYEMAAGRVPFKAETPIAILIKHINDPLPLPHSFNPTLPEALERVILKSLAKQRDDRYATAADMVRALQAAIPDVEPTGSAPVRATTQVSAPAESGGSSRAAAVPLPVVEAKIGTSAMPGITVSRLPTEQRRRIPAWGRVVGGLVAFGLLAGVLAIVGRRADEATTLSRSATQTAAAVAELPTNTPPSTAIPTATALPTATPTVAPTPFGGGTGRIAFISNRDGNFEIYVMNVEDALQATDGSRPVRLTSNTSEEHQFAWSSDGRQIAFHSNRDGNDEIYVMSADGSRQTRLTNNPANDQFPTWSPDNQKIAFISERDGNPEVYVMNVDGTGQINITNSRRGDSFPAWSPDGSLIAFASERDEHAEIYVMNAEGTQQTALTNSPVDDFNAAWSPDGTRIAFSSNRDGNFEIYMMNADGSRQSRLTNNPADEFHPAWSPDGTRIAFTSHRDDNYEIYVMNVDGTAQVRLTNNPTHDIRPSWQPLDK